MSRFLVETISTTYITFSLSLSPAIRVLSCIACRVELRTTTGSSEWMLLEALVRCVQRTAASASVTRNAAPLRDNFQARGTGMTCALDRQNGSCRTKAQNATTPCSWSDQVNALSIVQTVTSILEPTLMAEHVRSALRSSTYASMQALHQSAKAHFTSPRTESARRDARQGFTHVAKVKSGAFAQGAPQIAASAMMRAHAQCVKIDSF